MSGQTKQQSAQSAKSDTVGHGSKKKVQPEGDVTRLLTRVDIRAAKTGEKSKDKSQKDRLRNGT